MTFDQLCQDFDQRRPIGPVTAKTFFFSTEWTAGGKSVNDLLRDFLKMHGYEYLNTIDGTVWFLYHGQWRCCEHDVLNGNLVIFYLCEFIDN